MGNEVEPKVHDCIVRICQDCIDLRGQECHVPECVFCFKGMDEAKWLLDKMMICPIIDGERYILVGDAVEAEALVSPYPLTPEQRKIDRGRVIKACGGRLTANDDRFIDTLTDVVSRARQESATPSSSVGEADEPFSIAAHNERAIELVAQRWLEDAGQRRSIATSRKDIDTYDTIDNLLKMVRRQGVALLRTAAQVQSTARRIAEKIRARQDEICENSGHVILYPQVPRDQIVDIVMAELATTPNGD